MDFNKMKKDELVELAVKLSKEVSELKALKSNIEVLQKKYDTVIKGVKQKDEKIAEQENVISILKANLENVDAERKEIIQQVEDNANTALKELEAKANNGIADLANKFNNLTRDYELLQSSLSGELTINAVLLKLKKDQDKAIEELIGVYNNTLFEEGE